MHKRIETQIGMMTKGKSDAYIAEVKNKVEAINGYASVISGSVSSVEIVGLIMVIVDEIRVDGKGI